MTNSRGRAAVLLGLTFAAGLTVGLAVERYAIHEGSEDDARHDSRQGQTTIERFADELGVTNEQRAQIDPILEETREQMAETYDRFRPEWEGIVDSARARIEAVLTLEQVEEYRALLDEQERAERKRRAAHEDSDGSSE